jgi:hypothetical protein
MNRYYTNKVSDELLERLRSSNFPFRRPLFPMSNDDVIIPTYADVLDYLMNQGIFISTMQTEIEHTFIGATNFNKVATDYDFCKMLDQIIMLALEFE